MNSKRPSRELSLVRSDTFRLSADSIRRVFVYSIILTFPAWLYSCTGLEVTDTVSEPPAGTAVISADADVGTLDVFVFNNDRLGRLDSYQRFDKWTTGDKEMKVASCYGDKTMVILANSGTDRYGWTDINCRKTLESRMFDLENENPDHPVMSCAYGITTGQAYSPRLRTLSSDIILRSIRCDFSDRSYSGHKLTDIRIFLTNVNASCHIGAEGEVYPARIVNAGVLMESDMERFRHPELVYRELGEDVGEEWVYPQITLKAYPNCCREESIGTPFTRLVIEGKVNGELCYYPIPVNREYGTEEPGIHRNMCYIYDLNITRKGLTTPDGVINADMIQTIMEIKEWKEKDWYNISY